MYHLDIFFTHSSVLAWRIPGTAGPGGLLSMGSHRVGHNWSDLAAAAADIFFTKYSEHFLLNRMFHLNELVWLLMGLFFLIMRSSELRTELLFTELQFTGVETVIKGLSVIFLILKLKRRYLMYFLVTYILTGSIKK